MRGAATGYCGANARSLGRVVITLGCAIACSTVTSSAAAQTKTALSWVREAGAEGCIGAVELGRRVENVVGPMLVSAPDGQVSVEGRVGKRSPGFAATLVISDDAGRVLGVREVGSADEDCHALDDQLVFVIAVAIDPNAALSELPGELSTDPDPGPALLAELAANPPKPAGFERKRPVAKARKPEALAPDAGDAFGFGAGAGIAGGLGGQPDPAAGVRLEATLITGRWSHHAGGTLRLTQSEGLGPGRSVDFGFAQLELSTCPELWANASLSLGACAGLVVARLSIRPRGLDGSDQGRWILGPSLEIRAGLAIAGPFRLGLAAGGQSLWPRHRVAYDRDGESVQLLRVPLAMATGGVFAEARF